MSQAEIKAFLAANGPADRQEIAMLTGQTASNVSRCLQRLKADGFVIAEKKGKGSTYRLAVP
jgi:DNA-binding IclR family transcriptional regulator